MIMCYREEALKLFKKKKKIPKSGTLSLYLLAFKIHYVYHSVFMAFVFTFTH